LPKRKLKIKTKWQFCKQ